MAQNGQTAGTIFLNLSVNQNNLANQITSATNSTAASISGSLNNIFGKFLSVAALATALNTLKEFGTEALDVASNITEVQNVVDTAFDEMAYKCEAFAESAIDNFGISELSAKKTASTFMAMSKGMGMASESASNMSINVAKMAADVASFYNLSYDTASTKLKAIWTGETEGLKDLGIVMTQTNLQAYALSLGIEQNIQDMSQADQTTLRYKYVMEQLSLAQGDFAKTSDSWSNQTKILSESWTAFQGKIGMGLIEVFTPFLQVLNEIVDKMNDWADTMSQKFGWGEVVENAEETGEAMATAITTNTEEAVKAANETLLGLASMDQIQKLAGSTKGTTAGSIFGDIEDAYENDKEIAEEKESLLDNFISSVKAKIAPYEKYINRVWTSIKGYGTSAWSLIKTVGLDAIDSLEKFWNEHGASILDHITKFVSDFYDLASKTLQYIEKAWNGGVGECFSSLVNLLGSILELFFAIYDVIIGPLTTAFDFFMEHASQVIGDLFEDLSGILDILSGIADFFTNAINGEFNSESVINNITSGAEKLDIKSLLNVNKFLGIPGLPAFADGGIVSAPTIGLVGEYSNARTNPEVISPLGDLKQMMSEVVSDVIGGANGEIHLTVNLGTKTIVDEVVKGINKQTKRRNREVVVTTN